jgi:hypothetical protein
MTVVLNDPATLADLVRFGPVPHDVEVAARQQLPFENKFLALTAYEARVAAVVDSVSQAEKRKTTRTRATNSSAGSQASM